MEQKQLKIRNIRELQLLRNQYRANVKTQEQLILANLSNLQDSFVESLKYSVRKAVQRTSLLAVSNFISSKFRKN